MLTNNYFLYFFVAIQFVLIFLRYSLNFNKLARNQAAFNEACTL
jgi:hypothetical protein